MTRRKFAQTHRANSSTTIDPVGAAHSASTQYRGERLQEVTTSPMKIRGIITASLIAVAFALPALAKKTPQPFYQQTDLTTLKRAR